MLFGKNKMKRLYLGAAIVLAMSNPVNSSSISINDELSQLGSLVKNQTFPQGLPHCTQDDLTSLSTSLGITNIPTELASFLLNFAHMGFTCRELIYPQSIFHAHTLQIITKAWEIGVPKEYVPFCYDNADYYCVSLTTGEVRFWSHDEKAFSEGSNDMWVSFNEWVSKDWLPAMKRF